MAALNYSDLYAHAGHKVDIVTYYRENVAIECAECYEVLLDFTNELGTCDTCTEEYDPGDSATRCGNCGNCGACCKHDKRVSI